MGCGVKCGEVILMLMFADDTILIAETVVDIQCAACSSMMTSTQVLWPIKT